MKPRDPIGGVYPHLLVLLLPAAVAGLGLACLADDDGADDDEDDGGRSGDDEGDDDTFDDDAGDDDYDDDYDDDTGDDDQGDDDTAPPPPEVEEDMDPGTRPRICHGAVFVLNPEDDFVSRIDATTLEVETIRVGRQPSVLRATDDCAALLTLNTGADTASIIDTQDNAVTSLRVRPDLNELRMAPGGRYAVAYHHFDDDAKGYGEVSILDVREREVASLAVGFPPDEVVFTDDGRAVMVSETTLALVRLSDGAFTSLPTGLDVEQGQKLKKVRVTADGRYALLLAEASTKLLALDLAAERLEEIELGCYPTDLEVAENGDRSLLVCIQNGRVFVLDNGTLSFEAYDSGEVIGSGELTSDGHRALLFTNSQAIERVHLFETGDGELTTHYTVKPLIGAAIAPGDQGAVLFHYGGDGHPIDDFDAYFDTHEAFSVMNLQDGRINPVETPETPVLVSFGQDGRNAVIPLPGNRQVVLINLQSGIADTVVVPSTPIEVGVVSDLGLAFVLQAHDLGRISFIDLDTLEVRTITGFLLNGQIEG